MKAHKDNTKLFAELSYSEQAKSINAQILSLEASIQAHIKLAKYENRPNSIETNIIQVENLLNRLTPLAQPVKYGNNKYDFIE